jgi:hypothetical protein
MNDLIFSISNLKNQQIWFSAPKDFNDPFEFAFKQKSFSEEDYRNCYKEYERLYPQTSKGGKESDKLKMIYDALKEKTSKEIDKRLTKGGVCCFSEKKDDILMWSHYSDSHKGFCLEFDTNYDPFSKAKKVNYSFDFPIIDPLILLPYNDRYKLSERKEEFMKMITTKFKCWEYEKEWRIFHENVDQRYGYETQSLTGIYFGSEIETVHIEILALILQGQNPHTKEFRINNLNKYFFCDIIFYGKNRVS